MKLTPRVVLVELCIIAGMFIILNLLLWAVTSLRTQ